MGHTHGSRRPLLFLSILVLLGSVTVLFGEGGLVKISSPAHKAKVSGIIKVEAEMKTSVSPTYMLLVVDGTRPAATNSLPTTFQLDTRELSNGPHVMSAEAYTDHYLIAASKAITIYVKNHAASLKVKKQQRTPKDVTIAKTSAARKITKLAPGVRTAKITKQIAKKHGPIPEPVSLSTLASHSNNNAREEVAVFSNHTPMILINGKPLVTSVHPEVMGGHMKSGFRALFSAAGARVDWLAERRIARCVTDSLVVEVPIGSRMATVNGRQVDMGEIAVIKNGRTVVPLQFFAQATGSHISWDAQTRVASIQMPSRVLASAQASLTPATNLQAPVFNDVAEQPSIYVESDRAP